MARPKPSPAPETTPAESAENEDWTQFFANERDQIIVNIKRIEPVVYQGIQVGGHLAQLTLSPSEATQLADLLIQRWGGGLYGVQWMKRKEGGGYGFDKSFRIRCAGIPKLETPAPATVSAAPTPAQPPAPQAPMWSQGIPAAAYPWPHQMPPPVAAAPNPNALLQELPRLLGQVVEIARGGQPSPNGQALDTVALVQALQQAVRPEDDFSKFERFAGLMNKLAPKPAATAVEAVAQIDWVSLAGAAGEFFRAIRSAPAPTAPPQPSARTQPVAPVSAPPGWRWSGQGWEEIEEEGEDEEEGEGEGEEEEESETQAQERPPMTMEQLALEFQRMHPDEKAKVAQLAANFANLA